MKYIVYKTVNTINGKYYIGYHKYNKNSKRSKNYKGSGKLIKLAISKYGSDNFTRKILFSYDCSDKAFSKEIELISRELIDSPDCYNIKPGGKGGWSHCHNPEVREKIESSLKNKYNGDILGATRNRVSQNKREAKIIEKYGSIMGQCHTPEVIEKRNKTLRLKYDGDLMGMCRTPEAKIKKMESINNHYSNLGIKFGEHMHTPESRKKARESNSHLIIKFDFKGNNLGEFYGSRQASLSNKNSSRSNVQFNTCSEYLWLKDEKDFGNALRDKLERSYSIIRDSNGDIEKIHNSKLMQNKFTVK